MPANRLLPAPRPPPTAPSGRDPTPEARPVHRAAGLQVYLLGGFALAWDEAGLPPIPGLPARSLFAYLIIHRDRAHTRDLLAGTFWPDLPDAQARRRLSQALWQIGRVLNPLPSPTPYLLADADTVQFNAAAAYWLDVEEFGKLVEWETGRLGNWSKDQSTNPPIYQPTNLPTYQSTNLPHLRAAVTLYCGDFLAGFYDDWLIGERERLRELFLAALARLVELCKAEGAYEEALGYAQRLVAADPLHEEGHREVMRLYYLLGRSREALQQYKLCRAMLVEELGAEPTVATTALYHEITARSGQAEAPYLPQTASLQPAPLLEGSGQAPLVGRARERAALAGYLERAIGDHGGLLLLEGEAGAGKTRLLQEVARDAKWRGMQASWGRGRELADASPYGPLVEALAGALSPLRAGQLAQLVEEEWLQEASQLLPGLETVARPSGGPAPDGRAEARGASTPLPTGQARARLLEALVHVILTLGRITPHLLILEDLHWADSATLEALVHLAPQLAAGRVLVVGSYRGDEARARPAVWEALQTLDRAGCERIELAPLTAGETGELIRRGLGLTRAAPHFEARLHRETAGNPLFVLETLRTLHDEGLLYRDRAGEWCTPWDETTADYAEMPLPAGVREVIARRLARLEQAEGDLLQVAAVLGAHFDFALLLAASDLTRDAALKTMGELVRRRFLIETPQAYRFSHDQVRRVAYTGMPEARRRRLHRQAGKALEALRPEQIEALAYHFTQAQEADKALRYNAQAGDRARAVYAGAEAIGYYDRALEAWGCLQPLDPALGISLHQARGETCQETGRFDQAEAAFRSAHGLAVQAGDRLAQARALNSLSYLCFQRGDCRAAVELAHQALDLATADAPHQMADALLNQANALRNLGHLHEAIVLYQQAAAHFEHLDDHRRLADCLCRMSAASVHQGRYAEAQAAIERSLVLRRQLDDRLGISYSLINLTALYNCLGDFGRALTAAQEAYAVASAIGDPSGQDAALHNAGLVILEQGDIARAMPMLEEALTIGRQIGDGELVAIALMHLGRAHAALGDLAQAQALLEQSLAEMGRRGYGPFGAEAYAHLAGVLGATGRWAEAQAAATNGLAAAQTLSDPWVLGLAHRVAAEVAAQTGGEAELVERCFDESLHLLGAIGARAELARSLAAYGLYLSGVPEASEAKRGAAYVAEARSLFQQLGMAGDLARLDQDTISRSSPERVKVRLPRVAAPTGRPLREDEWIEVVWTVAAGEDEAIGDKTGRRQGRLLRLLRQAGEQGAAATVDDLAAALHVSRATIKRDLAELRATGQAVRTRGSRRDRSRPV